MKGEKIMNKSIGIGLIGLGMGRDLFYLNYDPESRFRGSWYLFCNSQKG